MSIQASENKVMLTFDDGPNPVYTKEILHVLQQYGVKAAFFAIGQHVLEYPEVIREVANSGHTIGNHTYSHPDLLEISHEEILEEIARTEQAIVRLTGEKLFLFRPPYGHFDDAIVELVRQQGYTFLTWTRKLDSRDWQYEDEHVIVEYMMKRMENGGIMLFHDSSNERDASRAHTVRTIRMLIPLLLEQGYQFIDPQELLLQPRIITHSIDEVKYF
ncbi:polysaccharide deacetylase family protein [Paenibacillus sp. N1-5-1-14]|uniref:polysaccharide deacetylase family protein n=1 Tax=Paenibacillus radicibacter TaxID=2972488 RepID=UPI0021598F01|nr:polysaccharide deacetylase family protein [Paenibacillus radicibacter]MCR8645159.1 polysaccharide deacetylase family protein [Paenibacillus radicibacter]